MRIEDMLMQIKDKELRQMTSDLIKHYEKKIKKLPASLSGQHHLGETHNLHLERTFWFAKEIIREFDLSDDEADVLLAAALLHDIGYYEFATKKRMKNQYQRLYQGKWNRSREAYFYHPVIGMFIIGKYMIEKQTINPKIVKTALIVSSHMSHWLNDYNPMPKDKLAIFLCLADYFASRNITLPEEQK